MLEVDLVAADRRVWNGSASLVVARSVSGDLGIMPGHTPVLVALADGNVKVVPESGKDVIAEIKGGGFMSVEHDRVVIVAEQALVDGETASS